MQRKKLKVLLFVPDGVGLRNFAFTSFPLLAKERGAELTYWNDTVFSIREEFGFNEVTLTDKKSHPSLTTLNRARKRLELELFRKRFRDPVYDSYKFPMRWDNWKNCLKNTYILFREKFQVTEKNRMELILAMENVERKTSRYQECISQLKELQPDMVFSTTQRSTAAVAPLTAAKDLGIPTACFIYSWDNVPKGMNVVETDYYFVWSQLMKKQLLEYYPHLKENQVLITGTPQFEPHYDKKKLLSKTDFYDQHNLDSGKNYFCFTGDDITTSPLDHLYLKDYAQAVQKLNEDGGNYGIIFRKVPTDVSDRYDQVLEEYQDIIVSMPPLWKPMGDRWDKILPTKEDFALLSNLAEHTLMVANIGSSTAFDFAIHNTPCLYFNYEQPEVQQGVKGIKRCYHYVHFRSMPSKDAVVWANAKEEIYDGIKAVLNKEVNPVPETQKWLGIVNHHVAPEKASERIWEGVEEIMK